MSGVGAGNSGDRGRVAVTGGTGFIGSRLARKVLEGNGEVRLGGRPGAVPDAEARRIEVLRDSGASISVVDLADRSALCEFFRGCDLVVHLAAAQHEANIPERVFTEVNVEGTRRVLEAAADAGVSRVVHGSTIGVYGQGSPETLDEESNTEPDNAYGRTKLLGEQVVRESADVIDAVIVRIGEAYGPGDFRLVKLFRGVQAGKFPLIGACRNLHQPIYIDDLVEVLLRAGNGSDAVGTTLIAAGPHAITTAEMAQSVAAALDRPLRALRVPMAPVLGVACAMEWTFGLLGIQPPLHRRRLDFYRKNLVFKTDRLRDILHFRPSTDFATGAKSTLNWYRENDLVGCG